MTPNLYIALAAWFVFCLIVGLLVVRGLRKQDEARERLSADVHKHLDAELRRPR